MAITGAELLEFYLAPQMEAYFLKKLSKSFSPDEIRVQIVELLKGLSIYHNCKGGIPFSEEIDEVWHLWILQTLQYAELCEKLPGKKFLHHSSVDYINKAIPADDGREIEMFSSFEIERLLSFFASYVYNFGSLEEPVMKYWPKAQLLQEAQDLSLQQFNDYLQALAE
jgi:hypothetical protein